MSVTIDDILSRRYNRNTYNCAHFVVDVWLRITGVDITVIMSDFLRAATSRTAGYGLRQSFTRLPAPVSPCVVLMRRKGTAPHVGVYLYDKVAHITELGAHYVPLDVAARGFTQIRFYAP